MAVTIDIISSGFIQSAGASPGTFNATVTAGGQNRYLLLNLLANDSSTPSADINPTAVTYAGSGMTFLVKARNPDATRGVNSFMYGLIAPPTGTNTVSFNLGASNYSVVGEAVSLTGVDQTNPIRTVASGIGNTQFPTITLNSATGDTVFDAAVVWFVDNTLATTGGNTRIWFGDSLESGGAGSTSPGAASVTSPWDFINVRQWAISAVSVTAAPTVITTNQTQTGKASIQKTVSRVQTGIANIASAASQYGRPSSDITVGNWISSSAQPLYATISGLNTNDPKYIYSPNTTSNTSEVRLSGMVTPISVSGHVVTIRAKVDQTVNTITVALYQGATLIQQNVFTPISSTFIQLGFLVSPANAATITDYTDLRLRFTAGP
jgi:hypothetical protein